MSIFNLSEQYISQSFQNLLQISSSGAIYNGEGTQVSELRVSNIIGTVATASYALYAVSASYEINYEASSSYAQTASIADFATSASYAFTASYALNAGNAEGAALNTGSLVTTSSFNAFTSSFNSFTSSYTTGSFTGSFTGSVLGNLIGNATSATTATTANSANQVAYSLTMTSSGFGDVPGTNYNGSVARAISYNTVGAPSTTGANASGTWNINITGSAGRATSASFATTASHVTGTIASASFALNAGTAQTASFVNLAAGPNVTINRNGTQYQISGSTQVNFGTVNRVARYNTSTTVTSSAVLFDDGTNVGIGTTTPTYKLQVSTGDALINEKRIGQGPGNLANTVFGGMNVLSNNSSGQYNTAIGDATLSNLAVQNGNTAVGYYAGRLLVSGENTVLGYQAGEQLSDGAGGNVIVGANAGRYAYQPSNQIIIGNNAGTYITGSGNIIIGSNAIQQGTFDVSIFIGTDTLAAQDPAENSIDSNYYETARFISIGHGNTGIRYWSQPLYGIASGSTETVLSINIGKYSAVFIDYVVCDVNAGTPSRAGTLKVHFNTVGSFVHTEEAVGEIGNSSEYTFNVSWNSGELINIAMQNTSIAPIAVALQCRLLERLAK
jgi:hypothetical protein